ncbi:uncharacterized protein V1513DRAFT_434671 [Lipomyces chichibuensis]|uniref:uncharacterized protein n=1 Tax=Lipomyces chichibuensis TaxID=1546026 RepID=UPI003343F2F2
MQLTQAILALLALAAGAVAQTLTTTTTSVTESFSTTLTGAIVDGTATPSDGVACFVATCPVGFTPSSAAGTTIISSNPAATATGSETFVFQAVPTNPTCSTCPSLTITPTATLNIVSATSLCGAVTATGFPTCPEVTLSDATFIFGATYSADFIVCTSACGGQCTTSIPSGVPDTSTGSLTLSTNPPTTPDSTIFCAASPTVSGFPPIDSCVNVPDVTFLLTADFVGPTPVCTSDLTTSTWSFGTQTTVISAPPTPFATQLTGTVGVDGTATPLPATPVCFTFASTSPTCPPGYTTTVAAGGASFTGTFVDVTATGAGALVFETAPASSCCPTQAILPFGNFGPTAATTICATPGASGFPTSCSQVTLGSATFTLGATYTANPITCTSTTSFITTTSISTLVGTAGTSTYSTSVITTTATDGNSASVSPSFCVTAGADPVGTCALSFTSSSDLGVATFTSSVIAVTATGTWTATSATSDTCTLSATAYSA